MELGMINRGEHSEILTFKGDTVDPELSGNMIDICPVGALTSKPVPLQRPHLGVVVAASRFHRGLGATSWCRSRTTGDARRALENEAVNECWIADRDRFSYETLNGDDRLQRPMLKQGGQWQEVDWQNGAGYAANGLACVRDKHGASAIGALVSPHSTLEELHLAATLVRGLGSDNIDHRLRRRVRHPEGFGPRHAHRGTDRPE